MLVENELESANGIGEHVVDLIRISFGALDDHGCSSFFVEIEKNLTRLGISCNMVCCAGKPTHKPRVFAFAHVQNLSVDCPFPPYTMWTKKENMEGAISYKLKRSRRARRMRLVVYCDGSVVLTTPYGLRESIVEKFLADQKQWLLTKLSFFKRAGLRAIPRRSRREYLANRERARALVQERIGVFNAHYSFSFNAISIRNQKSRWGSCSRKGNLNFNYKILSLPESHQDYIIVHELCHLQEFNHSKKFWALVQKAIPNYVAIKKNLRRHQLR